MVRIAQSCALAAAGVLLAISAVSAASKQVERGQYLVENAGCGDCHTPGYFLGKPDGNRLLGGSDVAFEIPGLGAFLGPNLTPDKKTGLGKWSEDEIVTAIQTGKTPEGRELAPIMPWRDFAHMTKADAHAIAAYLKSIPVVDHQVPGPFGPGEKVSTLMFRILPPGQTVATAPK